MGGKQRICIGFGPFEGTCSWVATVEPALLWCQRCEGLRRKHLDEAFAAVSEGFAEIAEAFPNRKEGRTTLPSHSDRDVGSDAGAT